MKCKTLYRKVLHSLFYHVFLIPFCPTSLQMFLCIYYDPNIPSNISTKILVYNQYVYYSIFLSAIKTNIIEEPFNIIVVYSNKLNKKRYTVFRVSIYVNVMRVFSFYQVIKLTYTEKFKLNSSPGHFCLFPTLNYTEYFKTVLCITGWLKENLFMD